jgi:tRNA-modifying protein YgfZ
MADAESPASIYARARAHGAVIDLSDRAKWRLRGADRVRYLNGQVTNDIRRLSGSAAMEACVTTAKGKLCGAIYVSASLDFLRIDSDGELRESLAARLERYIISDDAVLEDMSEEEFLLHVIAPEAPRIERAETRFATRFGTRGFDLVASIAEKARVLEELTSRYQLVGGDIAECLRIEAGVPRWGAELNEDTLPPEAGLDRATIDYHKGCYIGQEVISRIKSVGHVNRTLTGFTAAEALAPGMTLHPAAEPEKNAGTITSATWSFGLETWAGLGYLKRASADVPLIARDAAGRTVAVQARPLPLVP